MKKMSSRDAIALMILGIVVIGYVFLTWVYDPMTNKQEELLSEKEQLEDTLFRKNVPSLERKIDTLVQESKDVQLELSEIKTKRKFGPIDYQELITYLGDEADSLGVDVVQFKKHDFLNQNVYWEIPYEISVQGNYNDIILFVNSLYKLENYFYVTGMDLREVSRIPMSDLVVAGDKTLTENIKFDWANDFIEKLDKTIPSDIKMTTEDSFMSDFASEMESASPVPEEKTSVAIQDKLQLKFTFHFVSLDDPNQTITIMADEKEAE